MCGTIEYMAPEIVEGGESGHDKVMFTELLLTLFHPLMHFCLSGNSNSV